MLVLFDIDQTLLSTHAAGMLALERAGRDLHGDSFTREGVSYAGRLDPLIIADLLSVNGIERTPAAVNALRDGYFRRLEDTLKETEPAALKGAIDLVNMLDICAEPTLGLLTGNFEVSGRLKLAACGFDAEQFPVRIWGDASDHPEPSRDQLPPLGMRMYTELTGAELEPAHAVIVGDTVHDVACAKAHGVRVLAVATGKYDETELAEAGADRVVPDLTDTDGLCDWILSAETTSA